MNTATPRIDDAVRALLDIHDSRAGRPMTRNQSEGFEAARRDLSTALAAEGASLGEYVTLLASRAASTDDADTSETTTRELARVVQRNAAAGGNLRAELGRVGPASQPSARADGDSIHDLIKAFRSHGFAAIEFEPSEKFTTRALQSAGGSAIPTTFADRVAMYQRYATPMLDGSIVTIENRPNGAPIVFPRLTADPSTSGTVTADGAGITEADATISSITVQPFGYKLTSIWSRELDEDNAIGLEDLLARTVPRQMSIDAGTHLTTGTGTTIPWGIVARATNGGTATGTAGNTSLDTFFGPADLIDLKYALQPIYRARGAYMVSSTAMAKIRKFRDSNKQWLIGIDRNGVPTFDGSPIYENPAMTAVASATKSVMFGDLSAYTVVRVAPVRIEMSIEYKWNTDQVALRVVDRVSGDLPDTASVVYQVGANT